MIYVTCIELGPLKHDVQDVWDHWGTRMRCVATPKSRRVTLTLEVEPGTDLKFKLDDLHGLTKLLNEALVEE